MGAGIYTPHSHHEQRWTCDHPRVSQRDLAHVLRSLWDRSGGKADVRVAIADIDEDIGRGRGDMRTPLNLGALEGQGLVVSPTEGAWALTSQGVARIADDRELSDR
jgi:hypothetical protein